MIRPFARILFLLCCLATYSQAVTIYGTFYGPAPQTPLANGYLTLQINQRATLVVSGSCSSTPGTVVPGIVNRYQIYAGNIVGSPNIWGNDCLSPSGTYYIAKVVDLNGNVLLTDFWKITGTNSVNVSTLPSQIPVQSTNLLVPGALPVGAGYTAPSLGSLGFDSASNNYRGNVSGYGTNVNLIFSSVATNPVAGHCLVWVSSGSFGVTDAACGTGGGGTAASGSSGAVQFNTSGTLGSDPTRLFYDSANHRLGIGTNSPGYDLTITHPSSDTLNTQAALITQSTQSYGASILSFQTPTETWSINAYVHQSNINPDFLVIYNQQLNQTPFMMNPNGTVVIGGDANGTNGAGFDAYGGPWFGVRIKPNEHGSLCSASGVYGVGQLWMDNTDPNNTVFKACLENNGVIGWTVITSGAGGGGGGATAAGTGGAIQYNSGTNNTLAGTSNLYWSAANGRLGINTNSPNYPLTVQTAAGSTDIGIQEVDASQAAAAKIWLRTPSAVFVPEVNNAQSGILSNSFAIYQEEGLGGFPFIIDSAGDVSLGGNVTANNTTTGGSLTAWANRSVQILPTNTDPGCTSTSQVGKLWFNNSAATTVFNECVATAGTVAWVQVGTGSSGGSGGGGTTYTAGGSGGLSISGSVIDLTTVVPLTSNSPTITGMWTFAQGLTFTGRTSGATPANGNAVVYFSTVDSQLHMITTANGDTVLGSGSGGSTGGTGAAGATGQLQFNAGGTTFGASTLLTFNATANANLNISSTTGSPAVHVRVTDTTVGNAAQYWMDTPTGSYAIEDVVSGSGSGLANSFALYSSASSGFPLLVDYTANASLGGNFAAAAGPTITAWSNHALQILPISTDPGCTTTAQIGKLWFDNTTTTTVFKSCQNVTGTVGWVQVGTGSGGGGSGGGGTITAGNSGALSVVSGIVDVTSLVPLTSNSATIAAMWRYSQGLQFSAIASGATPSSGATLYFNSTDSQLHMVLPSGADSAIGSGGSGGSTGGTGAAGASGQIQYNAGSGSFGASTLLFFNATANANLNVGSTTGSPAIHVRVTDTTAGDAAQYWMDSPSGSYAFENLVAGTGSGLGNGFALYSTFSGGFPLAIYSSGDGSLGGNSTAAAGPTITAWNNHALQIFPTTTDPGCTATANIGKLWFDTTSNTTAFKSCQNVAGSVGWVAVGTGASGGSGGGGTGGTYTSGSSGAISVLNGVIDVTSIVPLTSSSETITGMYLFSQGITLKELASGATPASGNDVLYVSSNDHAVHLVNSAGSDSVLGSGGGGGGFGSNPTTTASGTNALTVASTANGSNAGAAMIQLQTPLGTSKWIQWDANNGGVLAGSTAFQSRDNNIKAMYVQGTGWYFGGNVSASGNSGATMAVLDNGLTGVCGQASPVWGLDCTSSAAVATLNVQTTNTTTGQENAAQVNLQTDGGTAGSGNRFAWTLESHESPGSADSVLMFWSTTGHSSHVMSINNQGTVGIGQRNGNYGYSQNFLARGDGTIALTKTFQASGTAIPTCNSGEQGSIARVSDATGPALGAAYASGGGAYAMVACNGSTWMVISF